MAIGNDNDNRQWTMAIEAMAMVIEAMAMTIGNRHWLVNNGGPAD
jgi:hypothetical protein